MWLRLVRGCPGDVERPWTCHPEADQLPNWSLLGNSQQKKPFGTCFPVQIKFWTPQNHESLVAVSASTKEKIRFHIFRNWFSVSSLIWALIGHVKFKWALLVHQLSAGDCWNCLLLRASSRFTSLRNQLVMWFLPPTHEQVQTVRTANIQSIFMFTSTFFTCRVKYPSPSQCMILQKRGPPVHALSLIHIWRCRRRG